MDCGGGSSIISARGTSFMWVRLFWGGRSGKCLKNSWLFRQAGGNVIQAIHCKHICFQLGTEFPGSWLIIHCRRHAERRFLSGAAAAGLPWNKERRGLNWVVFFHVIRKE